MLFNHQQIVERISITVEQSSDLVSSSQLVQTAKWKAALPGIDTCGRLVLVDTDTITYCHYSDVIMGTIAFQITTVRLFTQPFIIEAQIKENIRVTGLCVGNSPGPVNSPHKWPVTREMFPFDDVIMYVTFDGLVGYPGKQCRSFEITDSQRTCLILKSVHLQAR